MSKQRDLAVVARDAGTGYVNVAGDTMTGIIKVARGTQAKRDSIQLHVQGGIGDSNYDAITWYQGADINSNTSVLGSLRGVYTGSGRAELEWWNRNEIEAEASTPGSGKPYFRVDQNGRITMPYQPAFRARRTTPFVTSGGTILTYDSVDHNVGNHYSNSTGRFTAPISGHYVFSAHAQPTGTGQLVWINFLLNGNLRTHTHEGWNPLPARGDISLTTTFRLSAGDYIEAYVYSSGTCTWDNHGVFYGYLIG
jgi:hypothetical protein